MSLHTFVTEMSKLLGSLDHWLEKTTAHATAKKFDANAFVLHTRLAPDMLPLVFQIRSACDHAKWAASRCAGKDAPSHPDTEITVDEVRKRIASVREFLGTFTAKDFEGTADRKISLPRWEGKSMTGAEYFIEYAQPNFFFHLTSAYSILRHNGIELGKRDFLGALPMK
jgi:uncharacterized protein